MTVIVLVGALGVVRASCYTLGPAVVGGAYDPFSGATDTDVTWNSQAALHHQDPVWGLQGQTGGLALSYL